MSATENVAPAQGGPTPKGWEGFPCRYWQPVLSYKKSQPHNNMASLYD